MKSFLEMMRRVQASPCFDQMRRFAAPLYEQLGINHFWFYRITDSGSYSYAGTRGDWNEYYFAHSFEQHFPCLRHPRILEEGVQLIKATNDLKCKQVLETAWDQFQINFHLNILEKFPGGIEAFGFGSCSDSPHMEERLLNELLLLRYFIKIFRQKQGKLFQLLADNQVDLAHHMGTKFYERPQQVAISFDRLKFLRQLGGLESAFSLTPREKDVLKLLAYGFPASYIGPKLQLGVRTVENYMANIKQKLSCFSKVALIQKAQEIMATGFFDCRENRGEND